MEWKENPQMGDAILAVVADSILGDARDKPLGHTTELIYCLTRSYLERFDPQPRSPKATIMFLIGVGLGEVLIRPPLRAEEKLEKDGITCSIDWTWEGMIGELKTTRMAPKRAPEAFSGTWHKQLLSYMAAKEELFAVYTVLYVQPAVHRTWEVTAQQSEVDSNWTWMLSRQAIYLDYVSKEVVPTPFTYNEPWECNECPYRLTNCEVDPRVVPTERT